MCVCVCKSVAADAIAIANINDDRKMQNVHSVVVSFRFCMYIFLSLASRRRIRI